MRITRWPAGRARPPGDRLTHVEGVPLTSDEGWSRYQALEPGQAVRFTYRRDQASHDVVLTGVPRR